ncbi:MAG: hypothetical protein ABI162_09690 [Luteolibacter sp.]
METPEPLPRNPIYQWLRVMLWILPTGFLVISVGGLSALSNNFPISEGMVIAASVLLNVLFVIGAGWCDYKLSPPERKNRPSVGVAIFLFFLSQLFIVPILIGAVVFALYSFNPSD